MIFIPLEAKQRISVERAHAEKPWIYWENHIRVEVGKPAAICGWTKLKSPKHAILG
jgi:hypothetical protein